MIFVLPQVFAFGLLKEAFEVAAFYRDADTDEAKQDLRRQLKEIAMNQKEQLTEKEIDLLMSGSQTLE